jgi:hypothetical protein
MLTQLLRGAVIGLGVLVIALFATSATSYTHCAADHAKRYADQNAPNFFEKLNTVVVCEGATLDANGELVTAIATIFIAIFTLTLKQSTDRLWEAGERQIRALRQSVLISIHAAKAARTQAKAASDAVSLTRQQVRANVSIFIQEDEDELKVVLRRADQNPDVGQRPKISWQLFNGGMLAFIDVVRASYRLAPEMPDEPPYIEADRVEFLDPTIAANDTTQFKETTLKEEIWRRNANLIKGGRRVHVFLWDHPLPGPP